MNNLFFDSKNELRSLVIESIRSVRLVPIIQCLTVAKLPIDDLEKIFSEFGTDVDAIGDEIINYLDNRIDEAEFRELISEIHDIDELVDGFNLGKRAWFHFIGQLIVHYDYNVSIIESHAATLRMKKTQLTRKDKWGDVDDSDLKLVLREFSEEMLVGNGLEIIYDSLRPEVRLFLEHKNALDLFPRFVWLISELAKSSGKEADFDSLSTKEIGVEFEYEIKSIIEEANPDAVVEMTPLTGDQGADLIVYVGGTKIVIQAKRYTGNVGNSAVQEVYAAKAYVGADLAFVVTNSDYTKSARELASQLGVELLYSNQLHEIFSAF